MEVILILLIIGLLAGLGATFILPNLRLNLWTSMAYAILQKVLPSISKTEKEAIDAGDVWWEAELFRGHPDFEFLANLPQAKLTDEEQAFIDEKVSKVCVLADEWQALQYDQDLSPELWAYLRKEKFFGLMIPKEYGGLGFSKALNSAMVLKIATCSRTAAVTAMVPNSLGPAELLLAYGTEEQKNHYLPRLASGEDIPCFALTGPEAGSDAGSIPDFGLVCKRQYQGEEVLGIELTFDKRYITLAPIATVMGLAFKLYDPDKLLGKEKNLGITLALIPMNHPGVMVGDRHMPLNQPFMNGPIRGKSVFVPIDWIIGGAKMAGQGWRMLMERLAAGRGVSLPALSTAVAKLAYRSTGAYAKLRRQFNTSIGEFEGVQEAMARIAGFTYLLESTRLLTLSGLAQGTKSAVVAAIVKYHMTEIARMVINDAMDIHGGKGIMMGPKNYLGQAYQAMPISITVEGANILTRNLMIFGQGSIRCHSYLLKEMYLLQANTEQAKKEFDLVFWEHVLVFLKQFGMVFLHGLSFGFFLKQHFNFHGFGSWIKKLSHMSLALSVVSNLALLFLGGKLKRKERLSARLGDVLSYLYLATGALHYYHNSNKSETFTDLCRWNLEYCLHKAQESLVGFCNNFGILGKLIKFWVFPWGRHYALPLDRLDQKLAKQMMHHTIERDILTAGGHWTEDSPVGILDKAFVQFLDLEQPWQALHKALKKPEAPKHVDFETKLDWAIQQGIIELGLKERLLSLAALRLSCLQVDSFRKDAI
ncbi:MAG: acyl-CoA dehydrogenase [Gammaproteobacteria bacterium]